MRLIDADAFEKEIAMIDDLRKLSTKTIGEALKRTPTIEVVPVVHGEWVPVHKHIWQKNEDGEIDLFAWDHEFHNGPVCELCYHSPCIHCNPNWKTSECSKISYECSECGNHVKDKTDYCNACGADMRTK